MAQARQWLWAHKVEILIFVGAFAIRALYDIVILLHSGSHGFISQSDSYYFYYRGGLNLIQGHGFSIASAPPYYPDSYHAPLYPLFLAFLFLLRVPLFGIVLIQAVMGAAICALFYKIALKLTLSRNVALIAGVLAALEPMSIFWSGLLMSDTLFAFFMVLSFYFLVKKKFVHTALILGLAGLTRPSALYFAPVFILFVAYQTYTTSKNIKTAFLNALVILVLFFAVLSPWFTHNKIVSNTWRYSSGTWFNIYLTNITGPNNFSETYGIPAEPVIIADDTPTDFRWFSFEHMPAYKAAAMKVIKQNPAGYIIFEIKRTALAVYSSKYQYIPNQIVRMEAPAIFEQYHGILFFLVALGDMAWLIAYALVVVALSDKRLRPWWFFFAAVFSINIILSAIINPWGPDLTRYSIPFQGFIFSFAALGASLLWQKLVTWRA